MPSDRRSTKKCPPSRVAAGERGDGLARLGVRHLLGMHERQRVGLDGLADDELHAGQADAVVGQERGLEGEVGVAEVDHDLGRRACHVFDLGPLDVEGRRSPIDPAGVALGARDGHHLTTSQCRRGVARTNDGRDAELAGHDRGVTGTPATVGHDRRRVLHHRLPVRRGGIGDEDLARSELGELRQVVDDARRARGDLLPRPSAPRREARRRGQGCSSPAPSAGAGRRRSPVGPGRHRACRRRRPWPIPCPSAVRSGARSRSRWSASSRTSSSARQ